MQDILERLRTSSTNESSHELQCRCMDAAVEIDRLRDENERMTRVIRSFDLGGKPLEEQIEMLRSLLREALDNLDHRDLNIRGSDLADRIEIAVTPNVK